ncbi:M23 family metallopeptidase [Kitasatospora sp. CB02891]|uniref:M23 family metallopeptidase n=1 Tax=Kitasatospora sp. CB02891 TaxID=2020329 RepID=UPI000C27AD3B|nr:M23 family metallopeptidase [Kitasatospora sp. CB02891]
MVPSSRAAARAERRARARSATRTAVLAVALPSAAALGVFAAAVASAHPPPHRPPSAAPLPGGPDRPAAARPELPDRADRTSRQPADLTAEPAARRAEEEQAAAPAGRFSLPVARPGLSAVFGEPGAHWSARHTGIDFPVSSGTPVLAVTDGAVGTRWHPAYGRLATVTAPDGTRTLYGHLRAYRILRGPVRAGEVIGWSGSTGNSTGPHLHFEVRPDGETPVDPVPWLLERGLDPR